ncbi:MAG: PEP-CTERM sorting domain-containing protein [Methylophilaceae bacterium]|nr:PEP-CTERM sorting domain-containing protein [Methylophilaceae bacterium]
MNFKMKAIVAAIALTASMSASAAMELATPAGHSSLILTVLDTTAGVSATFDLGYNKDTFSQTTNNSWNLSTGNYASAWTSFWNTATAANTQYAVYAGDNLGGVVAGDKSIFTTAGVAVLPTTGNAPLGNQQTAFDLYITASNLLGNHGTVADGASFADAVTGGNAYAGKGVAYSTSGKIGGAGGDTNGLIGTDLNVWNIVRATGLNATTTKLSVGAINPAFNLATTGALTYTAAVVPEANTWAMMLAGLGLLGFVARRRS